MLSPPGGVCQDDFRPTSNSTTINDAAQPPPPAHTAGKAVMGTQNSVSFEILLCKGNVARMTTHLVNKLTKSKFRQKALPQHRSLERGIVTKLIPPQARKESCRVRWSRLLP
ncbi:ANK-REP-REGION domain-containing protein [Abeliophyllum distichum]|uniref:ANK-REP-REGION domain-containing protein n=1 Tax=Abeliophyllum distichum TaxID=126358 RepID=A0ABD1PAN8_9LAMI